jgi:phosphoribosyl-ATP pyrophosphohydrolase
MIGTPEEIACDLYMASASTLITEAVEKMTEEKRELLRSGIAQGTLRIVAEIPPLRFHILIVEPEGDEQHLITISDKRQKWRTWAQDLLRLTA